MKKDLKKLNVRVPYDHIITTLNVRKVTKEGIILTSKESGEILTRQTVLVCGPNSLVTVGEEVEINTSLFKKEYSDPKNGIGKDKVEVIPPIEIIEGEPYLYISSREIKWIYLDPILTGTTTSTSITQTNPSYDFNGISVKPC